jgi:hypothetical protein
VKYVCDIIVEGETEDEIQEKCDRLAPGDYCIDSEDVSEEMMLIDTFLDVEGGPVDCNEKVILPVWW